VILLEQMRSETGREPEMWGSSIVGFGTYRYTYRSGREAEWFLTGFSPRKQHLSLYFTTGFGLHDELLAKLGKFKTGTSCLYINKREDVDREVLRELIQVSFMYMEENTPQKPGN
jgi:hypothetical protein